MRHDSENCLTDIYIILALIKGQVYFFVKSKGTNNNNNNLRINKSNFNLKFSLLYKYNFKLKIHFSLASKFNHILRQQDFHVLLLA